MFLTYIGYVLFLLIVSTSIDGLLTSKYAISSMVLQRTSLKKQLYTSTNQKEKLEALCRSLQAERKSSLSGTLPSQASLQVMNLQYHLLDALKQRGV